MAKRGSAQHLKRLAAPKQIPLHTKKEHTWLIRPAAGGHSFTESIPLAVLLRDVLGIVRTMHEAKQILSSRLVLVDGRVRTEAKFPVGFMDVLDLPKAGKSYRIGVDPQGRLVPFEIPAGQKNSKLARVERKFAVPGRKISITLHDGKTLLSDNHLKVGDSVRVSLPQLKIESVLPLGPGVRCLVREGKHAGTIATLEEIIARREGRAAEARLKDNKDEFITVARYLFVVDEQFRMG